MTVEFAKKVETWNRKYKSWGCSRGPQLSRPPIQIEAEATLSAEQPEESAEPKKTFSQMIYEWNRHYKVGNKQPSLPIKPENHSPNTSPSRVERVLPDTEAGEEIKISISEKVAQWNHHYRKVDRKTKKCEKVELYDLEPETQLDLDYKQVCDRIGNWEKYYRPTLDSERQEEENDQNCPRAVKSANITNMVDHWTLQYSASRKPIKPVDETSTENNSAKETLKLVQHWNQHYLRKDQKYTGNVKGRETERKRKKVGRQPSLVKDRIEMLVTQSNPETTPRNKGQRQSSEITKLICGSNFAEIRSKFDDRFRRC